MKGDGPLPSAGRVLRRRTKLGKFYLCQRATRSPDRNDLKNI